MLGRIVAEVAVNWLAKYSKVESLRPSIDTNIILQMFQQSKMNAEDAIEKERLAQINEQL